jgi:WXG100 family type VII secretion target
MAGQISASPEELRADSKQIMTAANDARSQFSTLQSQLSDLPEKFTGQASTAFTDRYNEWNVSAQKLADALEALGKFLSDAADTVEQTDAQLAHGIGGG